MNDEKQDKKPSEFDLEAFNRHCNETLPVTSKWVDLEERSEYTLRHSSIRRLSAFDPHAGSIQALETITAFLEYHEKGEAPPKWVMDDLYSRFKEYYLDNLAGKRNAELGRYFDDKNRSGMFFKHVLYPEIALRCSDVAALVVWFGLSRGRACGIVGSKLKYFVSEKYNPMNKEDADIPGPDSLQKHYYSPRKKELEEAYKRANPTDVQKLRLLERYEDFLSEEQRLIDYLRTLRRAAKHGLDEK